jgi:hypothetical protein
LHNDEREGGLLLADDFFGHLPEAAADGGELELDGVRVDQRFERRRPGVLWAGHRAPPISWS